MMKNKRTNNLRAISSRGAGRIIEQMKNNLENRSIVLTNRGSTVAVSIILLTILTSILLYSASASLHNTISITKSYDDSRALAVAEGGMEKAIWKLRQDISYTGEPASGEIDGGKFDVSVTPYGIDKFIKVTACVPSNCNPTDQNTKHRKAVKVKLSPESTTTDVEFNYGAQVGSLGLQVDNNAAIVGSVYSDSSIKGGNGSAVTGDVTVALDGNSIENVSVKGNVWSDIIKKCTIVGNAYHGEPDSTHWVNSTIVGSRIRPSDPKASIDLPIKQSVIDTWKNNACGSSSWQTDATKCPNYYSGDYIVSSNRDLGPKWIGGALTVQGGITLNMTGTIWVESDVTLRNSSILKLDSINYKPGKEGVLLSHGKITIDNLAAILGRLGDPDSTTILLTTANQHDIRSPVIEAGNNSVSAYYYAQDGWIYLKNNASIKAAVGQGLHLNNNAVIQYAPSDISVDIGAGGKWAVKEWQEVQP